MEEESQQCVAEMQKQYNQLSNNAPIGVWEFMSELMRATLGMTNKTKEELRKHPMYDVYYNYIRDLDLFLGQSKFTRYFHQ